MKQPTTGFHKDEHGDWVAELACDHTQHVRHNPPWVMREWVTTEAGREAVIGRTLECKECDCPLSETASETAPDTD